MRKALLRAATLMFIVGSVSGCVVLAAGAVAGASGAVYVKGQLKETVDGTVPEVHRAAQSALHEIGVGLTVDKQDEFSGQLQGEMAKGQNVWVDVERVTASTTRIVIRVGYMGDQPKSADILERVKRNLYGL